MKKLFLLVLVLAVGASVVGCAAAATPTATPQPPQKLILATTTSTADSGLLDFLLPDFETKYNCTVDYIAVGTGQSLAIGAKGDADVVLVHARAQEDKFISDGDGVDRQDVMYNDFVVVGPAADPAGIQGMTSASEAFAKIADGQSAFASRGDGSGTETKEKAIWKQAGIEPDPNGGWYFSLGQGMGDTLLFADEKGAYTLTDRGTYLSMQDKVGLTVMVGGNTIDENKDSMLLNPYGVIAVNPVKHPNVNYEMATKFIDWLTSVEAQQLITQYKRNGQPLFYPDSQAWKSK